MTDSFIKKQQQEARESLKPTVQKPNSEKEETPCGIKKALVEEIWNAQKPYIDTLTAQIIRNTCEKIRKELRLASLINVDGEGLESVRLRMSKVEDIINKLITKT